MPTVLRGMGWVTPLGAELQPTWERLCAGERGEVKRLAQTPAGPGHPYRPIPPALVQALGRHPRLRRSSPISYYAGTAGLAALAEAGLSPEEARARRTAVILAVASGSVLYTRRFYEQVHGQGAQAASPMLFPETVYNAPASHVAALLGIDGASYTLVGDASVGLAALKMAEQLLARGEAELCLVVAAEELDWVLCQGYRDWRFTTAGEETCLYGEPPRGAMLAEGGAAVLLAAEGAGPVFSTIHAGVPFLTRAEAGPALHQVLADLQKEDAPEALIGSANGSFMDAAEGAAVQALAPVLPLFCPKAALGEALGAGALQGVVAAGMALRTQRLPGVAGAGAGAPAGLRREPWEGRMEAVGILATGLNQQAAGAVLRRAL